MKARDANRKSDLAQIKIALHLYYNDQKPNKFPEDTTWRTDLETGNYMPSVPHDPNYDSGTGSPDYTYCSTSACSGCPSDWGNQKHFKLQAILENKGESDTPGVSDCQGNGIFTDPGGNKIFQMVDE